MEETEDLNTYVNNICYKYQDLNIIVSNSAMRELLKQRKTLLTIIKILEQGYDAPRQRKLGTIEKWFDEGNKTFNAVIVKDFNEILKEECWVLIHFGKFTRRNKNEMQ